MKRAAGNVASEVRKQPESRAVSKATGAVTSGGRKVASETRDLLKEAKDVASSVEERGGDASDFRSEVNEAVEEISDAFSDGNKPNLNRRRMPLPEKKAQKMASVRRSGGGVDVEVTQVCGATEKRLKKAAKKKGSSNHSKKTSRSGFDSPEEGIDKDLNLGSGEFDLDLNDIE